MAVPIWSWMGSVVQTSFEPTQHAKLHATPNLVFELRVSSPDGAVEHRRVNMVFASKAGSNTAHRCNSRTGINVKTPWHHNLTLSELVSHMTHVAAVIGVGAKEKVKLQRPSKPPRILHALADRDHETSSHFLRAQAQTFCTVRQHEYSGNTYRKQLRKVSHLGNTLRRVRRCDGCERWCSFS